MDLALEKAKINLADVIRASGVELQGRGRRSVGLCPFHSEKTGSFTVFEDDRFYCFGCHEHGDVIDYVKKRYNLDFIQALQFLGIETGGDTEIDDSELRKELERKKAEAKKHLQRKRDLLHTLSLLIRTTENAAMTPDNFKDYAEILGPLPWWTYCHDTLIYGADDEKKECIDALSDMPTVSRNLLFDEDFNYRGWLRIFIYGEPTNEPKYASISFE